MQGGISVVVNTLNEEKNIEYALRSVKTWADEIIVVDMHSEDRTVEIAKEYGAQVFYHDKVGFVEPARKFGIEKTNFEWVLILDADEIVSAQLSKRLQEIWQNNEADVVSIPRLNYLIGASLMHTLWGPEEDAQTRFFKKQKLELNDRIHDGLKPTNGARVLKLKYLPNVNIVHFNFIDFAHHIEKINRYTTIEASQAFRRGERASIPRMCYSAVKEFLSRYLIHKGYRDGWRGLYLSINLAFYRIAIFAKLTELEKVGDSDDIKGIYIAEAEDLLNKYVGNTNKS